MTPGSGFVITAVVSLTAGTMFLMWLGEQITERGIGNGISLIIFAGIVAGLPSAVLTTLQLATRANMHVVAIWCSRSCLSSPPSWCSWSAASVASPSTTRAAGRSPGLHEPELAPAAEAQHVGRDPADLRIIVDHVPGHGLAWFSSASDDRWLQNHCQDAGPGRAAAHVALCA
jgi:preprotein translocase subunit SecY